MHCLVTGASGFLGSWLVRRLSADGHSVTALTRDGQSARWNADWFREVKIVPGSLEDLRGLDKSIDSIDVVFHLAWFGVTSELRNHTDQISRNVIGCLRLWELAREAGCKHWIGMGSQAEYGSHADVHTRMHNGAGAYPRVGADSHRKRDQLEVGVIVFVGRAA